MGGCFFLEESVCSSMVSAFFFCFGGGGVFFRGFNHCTKKTKTQSCRPHGTHYMPREICSCSSVVSAFFFGGFFEVLTILPQKHKKSQKAAQTQVQPLWMPGLFEPAASTPSLLGWSGLPPHYNTKQLFSFSF